MYVVFHSNFATYIVHRRYKPCEFLWFVWTDCWGNKSYYVITSPANKQIYSMDTPKLCTCNYAVSLEVLWLVQLSHRFMMQGKQLFTVHAAFLSQYLECLLNVAQSRTSYPKLVRGRAILQCNSLDSSWISLGLLYHTVTSWTIIFHDTVKHENFMNSSI